jgi:hypothetical protein
VDTWAAEAARARGLEILVFRADWKSHGKAAGVLRNTTIVEAADQIVAFWDGRSRGTKDTIAKAGVASKPVIVFWPKGAAK